MRSGLLLVLIGCGSAARPDTVYQLHSHGSIDLGKNPHARHCSELTRDFRDARGLEALVQTLSLVVAADESRADLRTEGGAEVPASTLIGDRTRMRAFWYYDDWTLAVVLDHARCPDGKCPAEISLIRYNGARTPTERPAKLCFERWVGTFTAAPREAR